MYDKDLRPSARKRAIKPSNTLLSCLFRAQEYIYCSLNFKTRYRWTIDTFNLMMAFRFRFQRYEIVPGLQLDRAILCGLAWLEEKKI